MHFVAVALHANTGARWRWRQYAHMSLRHQQDEVALIFTRSVSPLPYEAAWRLCRKQLLAPWLRRSVAAGATEHSSADSTDDGALPGEGAEYVRIIPLVS